MHAPPPAQQYSGPVDPGFNQQPPNHSQHEQYNHAAFPQAHPAAGPPTHQSSGDSSIAPGQAFYQHQDAQGLQRVPTGAPEFPPQRSATTTTEPGAAGMGAGPNTDEQAAAWAAYYRQQAAAQQQQQQPAGAHVQAPAYGASPYPPHADGAQPYGSQLSLDQVTGGVSRMSVHG